MATKLIQELEKSWERQDVADVSVGDTVSVGWTIVEGKKKRVQRFEGIIIKATGARSRRSITVRKIVDKNGVEKTFLLHSPLLADINVISKGNVRRARLYYLRDRIGAKATRVKTLDYKTQLAKTANKKAAAEQANADQADHDKAVVVDTTDA